MSSHPRAAKTVALRFIHGESSSSNSDNEDVLEADDVHEIENNDEAQLSCNTSTTSESDDDTESETMTIYKLKSIKVISISKMISMDTPILTEISGLHQLKALQDEEPKQTSSTHPQV